MTSFKHRNKSLFQALVRIVSRLRTSLYQSLPEASAGSHGARPDAPYALATGPRRTARIIPFPGAKDAPSANQGTGIPGNPAVGSTDEWYSRAVAKSVPHRPFPSSFA